VPDTLLATVLFVLIAADLITRHSRRRFRQSGDAFRCRLRTSGYPSAIWPRLTRRWSRPMWALWTDDVLLVRRGPILARTLPLPAQITPTGVYTLPPGDVKRCGPRPIAITLRVWDGSRIDVATDDDTRLTLVGPYLAAAINDLPQAPDPPRHRYRPPARRPDDRSEPTER
jgi:hypothetical protein